MSKLMWGGKWQGRSPENVLEELIQLKRTYNISRVCFSDEEINYDRNRAQHLYQLMTDAGLNLKWFANTSIKCLDRDLIDDMVRAGLSGLFIGYESGAPNIIRRLGKAYDLETGVKIARHLQKRGVFVSGNFIYGLPWESEETLKQTNNYIKRLNLDVTTMSYYWPLTGTSFHNLLKRENLFDPDDYDEINYVPNKALIKTYYLSEKQLKAAAKKFIFAAYMRPGYWVRILVRTIKQPWRMASYAEFFGKYMLIEGLKNYINIRRKALK